MTATKTEAAQALTLDSFWRWAAAHYNCILRAGSDQCVIYDQRYLHWHLIEEEQDLLVVQVVRGKDLVSELVIDARQVAYVESSVQDDENVLFELVGDVNGEPVPLYHFVMAHGFDDDAGRNPHEWTH
jgi:hypothetical protein